MTARHLHPVPDPVLTAVEQRTSPNPDAPRGHAGWRPARWWRLHDELRRRLSVQPVPWEQHPTRATTRLEFRAP